MARSGTDRIFLVQFRPESGGKEPAGIEKSCTGTNSDFNAPSRRNDQPGTWQHLSSTVHKTHRIRVYRPSEQGSCFSRNLSQGPFFVEKKTDFHFVLNQLIVREQSEGVIQS
ncbi:unnamed protein product [Adineta ricciae]|uniref:Uncharacterized protein n=1 Tax=Adineta ricciae TaxID=249248 RepID=A0A813UDW7_ADIRI|nr:unnamed protein product [Adineta ricciae]